MQQIPQDTAQQILASREAYKTATSTLSKPTSFNIGQLTTQAMSGGIGSAVLSQQQRTATELQRQQALEQVQSEYKQFEIGAQEAATAMASSSKEDADWVLAQKLIDRNKEYAASGDPSVISKIKYLKTHGGRGLAQATATSLIREKFTPEGVTATLKSTMYKGKSLAEAAGLEAPKEISMERVFKAGTGWVYKSASTMPSYVSESAYETMLQKVATGQKASKTLLALGSTARERPIREIESLMKTSREGREFENLIVTKKITPFIADTGVTTLPEKKVTMESSPFQIKDITGTILGGGTAGGRTGGAGEFLTLDNEYNKLISKSQKYPTEIKNFTAAVDIGGEQMQDYKIVYGNGRIISYTPIGAPQKLTSTKVKLNSGSFGGAGAKIIGGGSGGGRRTDLIDNFFNRIETPFIGKESTKLQKALYAVSFGVKSLGKTIDTGKDEYVTESTVKESYFDLTPFYGEPGRLGSIGGDRGLFESEKNYNLRKKAENIIKNEVSTIPKPKSFIDTDFVKSFKTRYITSVQEADLIKYNIQDYNKIAEQLTELKSEQDVYNEDISKRNEQSDKITKDILSKEKYFKKKGEDYLSGKINRDKYMSYYNDYKKAYDEYKNEIKNIDSEQNELKLKSENIILKANDLMSNEKFKAIQNLINERGPLTTLAIEKRKDLSGKDKQLLKNAISYSTSFLDMASFINPYTRVLKGASYLTTGVSDISVNRTKEGLIEAGVGSLILFGPAIFKTTGKAVSKGSDALLKTSTMRYLSQTALGKSTAALSTKALTTVSNFWNAPIIGGYQLGGAIPSSYTGLATSGATQLGIQSGGISYGTVIAQTAKTAGVAGIGTLVGLERYKTGADIGESVSAGLGAATALTVIPFLASIAEVKTLSQVTDKPIPKYKTLATSKTSIEDINEKGIIERLQKDTAKLLSPEEQLSIELRTPFKVTTFGEMTTPGLAKVSYAKGQLLARDLLKKIGIPYSPAPLAGSPTGGYYTVGFGKGYEIKVSPETAKQQYEFVLKRLQKDGLTLAQAEKVLEAVPARDFIYKVETEGIKVIPMTTEPTIVQKSKINVFGKTGVKSSEPYVMFPSGKLTTYDLKGVTGYIDPVTGKYSVIRFGNIDLGKVELSAAQKQVPAFIPREIVKTFETKLKPFEDYGKVEKTFTTSVPLERIKSGTSEFAITSLSDRKNINIPRQTIYQGGITETSARTGKQKYVGGTYAEYENQRVTNLYDPDTNELVATKIVKILPNDKQSKAKISLNDNYSEYKYMEKLRSTNRFSAKDFDSWKGNRETILGYQQLSMTRQAYIPKGMESQDSQSILFDKPVRTWEGGMIKTGGGSMPPGTRKLQVGGKEVEVTTPIVGGRESKGVLIRIGDVTQTETSPPKYLVKEKVFKTDLKLVLGEGDNARSYSFDLKLGKGQKFELESHADAESLYYAPEGGVRANLPGSRIPGPLYDVNELTLKPIVAQKVDIRDIISKQGETNVRMQLDNGKVGDFFLKLNRKTGEISMYPKVPYAKPIIIREGISNLDIIKDITKSTTTKAPPYQVATSRAEPKYSDYFKNFFKDTKARLSLSANIESRIDYDTAIKEVSGKTPEVKIDYNAAIKDLKSPSFDDIVKSPTDKLPTDTYPTNKYSTMTLPYPDIQPDFTNINIAKEVYKAPPSIGAVPFFDVSNATTTGPVSVPVLSPIVSPVPIPEVSPIPIPIPPVPTKSSVPSSIPIVSPIPAVTPIPTTIPIPTITPVPTPTPTPVTIPYITPRPLIAGRIIPIVIPKKEQKKKKTVKKKGKGFEVEIRRKGKFKEAAPFAFKTKEEAVSFGARKTLQEAAATFRIKPSVKPIRETSATPVPVSKYFRPPKKPAIDTYVQKKTLRITTPGEKKEISFKGAMAKRAKGSTNFLKSKQTKYKKGRFF